MQRTDGLHVCGDVVDLRHVEQAGQLSHDLGRCLQVRSPLDVAIDSQRLAHIEDPFGPAKELPARHVLPGDTEKIGTHGRPRTLKDNGGHGSTAHKHK